jgi:diadenosine tetraphosphatase ApaH/serine/threonine PP2A family protein phosphatase
VGQPRDKDPRAAYAILEHDTIVFRRVEYDLQTTIKKIQSDPDIDDMYGNRLPQGR